jgi:hypothetical protein
VSGPELDFSTQQAATARNEIHVILAETARRRGVITYVDLASRIRAVPLAPNDAMLAGLLGEISTAEDEAGRGLLTALVVRQDTLRPGRGFFRMAARQGRDTSDPLACWERERERVYAAWAAAAAAEADGTA